MTWIIGTHSRSREQRAGAAISVLRKAACLRCGERSHASMSERKSRLTITVDPDLGSYAERLVASGQAASVSAAFNEVMAEKAYRDRRRLGLWKARGDQADPGRVARMMAHVDQQLAGE
jgi:endonuclease YncB( thermonuclease family)